MLKHKGSNLLTFHLLELCTSMAFSVL